MRNSCKFQICARTKYKQSGPPKVSNKQHFSCCDIPILVKKWFSKNEEMISYYSKSFVRQQLAGNHFQQKDCLLCYVYRASQEPLLQSFIQVWWVVEIISWALTFENHFLSVSESFLDVSKTSSSWFENHFVEVRKSFSTERGSSFFAKRWKWLAQKWLPTFWKLLFPVAKKTFPFGNDFY